jgi:hypothetical protein
MIIDMSARGEMFICRSRRYMLPRKRPELVIQGRQRASSRTVARRPSALTGGAIQGGVRNPKSAVIRPPRRRCVKDLRLIADMCKLPPELFGRRSREPGDDASREGPARRGKSPRLPWRVEA